MITLNKEVRNLRTLGYRVPLGLVNKSINASHMYPYFISLGASLATYRQTLAKLEDRAALKPLVASYHSDIQRFLSDALGLTWDSFKLDKAAKDLSQKVSGMRQSRAIGRGVGRAREGVGRGRGSGRF